MASRTVLPLRRPLDAVVDVPGSKSIANRALVCAALADGPSVLHNVPDGDDTEAMLDCLLRLEIAAERVGTPDEVHIAGCGASLPSTPVELPTRLAGTTSRFITAVAALGAGPYRVDGEAPLRRRPMGPLHDALVALGADVRAEESWGHLPVAIRGPVTGTDDVGIRGDVSSQFLTALMLIGPYVPGGLRLTLTTSLVSRPYVEMTKAVMAGFGHDAVHVGESEITVDPGRYRGCTYAIEPDASSASYPLAAAAICVGRVEVPGLGTKSLQGDAVFADLLEQMGCTTSRTATSTVVEGGDLRGIDVDMAGCSDLVPSVAAVAAFAESATRVRGVGFIRAKESDRLADLCTELRRLGVDAQDTEDGLLIAPSVPYGATVETHHDHRLAMAFGVIGLRVDGVEIDDPDVVSKSWPGFWNMLDGLQ